MKRKFFLCLLTFILALGLVPVSAKESVTVGGSGASGEDVVIVKSGNEFQSLMNKGKIERLNTKKMQDLIFTINEDGCLIIDFNELSNDIGWNHQVTGLNLYANKSKTAKVNAFTSDSSWGLWAISDFSAPRNGEHRQAVIPVSKGDTIVTDFKYYNDDTKKVSDVSIQAGFIPADKLIPDPVVTRKDGKITIKLKTAIDTDDYKMYFQKGTDGKDEYYANNTKPFTEIKDNQFTVSAEGKYSVVVKYNLKGNYCTAVKVINTKDYGKENKAEDKDTETPVKTTKGITEPLAAVYKSNIIVGYATPKAEVSIKIGSTTYSGNADKTGLYKIITNKLGKNANYTVWETVNGKTSDKLSFKTTTK